MDLRFVTLIGALSTVSAAPSGISFIGNLSALSDAVILQDKFFSEDGLDEANINAYIRTVLENFKEHMKMGLPEMGIPILDPYTTERQNFKMNDTNYAVFALTFTNLVSRGLSQFVTKHLWVSVRRLQIDLVLLIPELRVTTDYNLNGTAMRVIPLFGNGNAVIEADNLTVGMTATLSSTEDQEHIQLEKDFKATIDFDRAYMDFQNLLGGRPWTVAIQSFLNRVNKGLFRHIMVNVQGAMNTALLDTINEQLMEFPIKGINPGNSANEYVDQLLYLLQDESLGIDPMQLPDFVYNFSKSAIGITWRGEAKLFEGELQGLTTLHRTGNCTLRFTNDTMSVSASLGLDILHIQYKGHAKFMSIGPSISCNGTVENMSLFFRVLQSSKKGSKPLLEDFDITELGDIQLSLTGLGPLNWIVEKLMSGAIAVVRSYLMTHVTTYLRDFIQAQLEQVKLPFAK